MLVTVCHATSLVTDAQPAMKRRKTRVLRGKERKKTRDSCERTEKGKNVLKKGLLETKKKQKVLKKSKWRKSVID